MDQHQVQKSVLTSDAMSHRSRDGRLPLTVEQIDTEFLTSALSNYAPGIVVEDFEIVDVYHGFTTVLRLRLDVNDVGREAGDGPTVMFKAGFEDHSPSRCRTYAMEASAYRDRLWETLGLNVPQCYFADIEAERSQVVMIMEDLVARDVTFGDPFKPHNFEQASLYVAALAQLHAKTWDSPDIKPGGRWASTSRFSYDLDNVENRRWVGISNNCCAMLRDYLNAFGYFNADVWERFLAMPRCAAISRHLLDLEWAKTALDQCAALMDALPQCVVHGDTHLGNLYWDADGSPGFFDAPPRIEPGHLEVGYYLACALDPADRCRWERDLVGLYLDELGDQGVAKVPSLDEMMHYMSIFLTYGLIVFIINENSYQTESFNTVHAMRYSAMMTDLHSKEAISSSMESDPYLA